jgi:hypothetical protein
MHQWTISKNINEEWEEIKMVAMEALRKRQKRNNKRGLKIWNNENAQITDERTNNYGQVTQENKIMTNVNENVYLITMEEMPESFKSFKNKNTPGTGGLNMELVKYASQKLLICFLDLINICWRYGHVPKEWNIALITPIYMKGDR